MTKERIIAALSHAPLNCEKPQRECQECRDFAALHHEDEARMQAGLGSKLPEYLSMVPA